MENEVGLKYCRRVGIRRGKGFFGSEGVFGFWGG